MGPVFSLVLDEDVSDEIALRYPELYKDLVKVSICVTKVISCEMFDHYSSRIDRILKTNTAKPPY